MAGYRQIHTSIWKDEWFLDLEPDDKLLFIYLFSNDSASVAGIYKLALKVIAFETGLSLPNVKAALNRFSEAGKVYYQDGVVWVKNLRKYNESASPKVVTKIESDLADIPDGEIKRMYTAFYGGDGPGYPIDTVSIPYPELETEHEHEQEHEHERAGANAPERRKRRAPAPVPPAVRVFQEITNRYPPKAWYARIDDAVGTDPDNLAFWRQVVTEYLGTYQNQGNVKAMLDFYRRRELPGTRRGNGRDSPRASPVVLERHVADLPKGWLQEPFDPDEEPQL